MTESGSEPEIQREEYEGFLEDFGEQLDRGRHRARKLRSRRRVTAGGLALAAIAVAIIAVTSVGGGRVDVVAEAEAALAPAGQLLRIVTSSRLEMRGGAQAEVTGHEAESLGLNKPRVAEEWSTSAPTRWRIATTIPTATAQGSTAAAALQCAYSNGSEETYNEAFATNELDLVPVGEGHDEASEESPCTNQVSAGLGTDPVAHIHSLLEARQLQPAGSGTVDGRVVLRLTGAERPPTIEIAGNSNTLWPVEYEVDPETYAPVRFTVEMVGANTFGNIGTLTEVTDVSAYEQLPLGESTVALLSIKTTGNPVIRHGLNQYEARQAAAEREARTASAARKRAQRHRSSQPRRP
jgi:hypothetical protein